ncbi:MAG: helix-turn-helix domain-containing protein [Proteobacteria bacterium]|nr:helix-turn-helix domain-containing protein [Pseudomonadota bacterium]
MMKSKETQEKEIIKRIGMAIKFWRKLSGYNQESFSQIIETSRSYVAKLETGGTGVSINKINEIARALRLSPFTLLCGVPNKEALNILMGLYNNYQLNISRSELEILFCARLGKKKLTRDYYIHQLCILRSGNYSCKMQK